MSPGSSDQGSGEEDEGNWAQRVSVLIVDDEPQLQRLMARVLGRDGYYVRAVSDSDEAFEQLDGGLKPELAILDVIGTRLDGGELMPLLSERVPGLRVVLTSGSDLNDPTQQELAEAGGSFLRKPFAPRTLSELIQRTLAGESLPRGI